MSLFAATVPLAVVAQEVVAPAPTPEKRFVSDKLVLNVYSAPEQGSARVATIQTGDAVEELERSGNLVRVRLEDGREGWVGANYLVSDAPAVVRLRELQRQQPSAAPRIDKASVEEIAKLKKENAALKGQVSELQSRVTAVSAQAAKVPAGKGQTERVRAEKTLAVEAPAESETTVPTDSPDPAIEAAALAGTVPQGGVWGWLIAMMFVGAVSYAGGYQTLARRLRKKFGGLKIY